MKDNMAIILDEKPNENFDSWQFIQNFDWFKTTAY